VAAIAGGQEHTCAVTSTGGVKCWGDNFSGQLGDGTTTDRRTPVDVSGLSSSVVAVAVGAGHSCALTGAGGVKCWGENNQGQLGDGTTTDRHVPANVLGLPSGVKSIAAAGVHTCALMSGGALKCWGANDYGELGDGTTTQRNGPVEVSGLESGVAAVAAGGDQDGNDHTCALTNTGVKCWGLNSDGELGDGTTTNRHIPGAVSGLASGVIAVAVGGGQSCALTSLGRIKCWGWNYFGQLGDGTTVISLTPVGVLGFGGSLKCAVPYALGFSLPQARSMITHAHCRVGAVKGVASRKRKNTVVGQSPRPFKRLKKGARVKLKVSRGPRA
jgi:alpha-tubulin suppressor-like RCC1 family protein